MLGLGQRTAFGDTHEVALVRTQVVLRMQKATGQLAKTHDARRVRREIARVMTLLGQPQPGTKK